ncbi:MAG: glutamate racemase [Saprospiraceae bacterium]|nr:glutamate racemase [Candidatus Vicinibacter affinis]MBP6172047.1 glutamate racemase [Saprospiraceae bacterium]MBK6822320.1 glutamate racemase [Candidatus Vicinibacter affinis]MBK7301897.1 glutamate racemase [Candidatus Vicinibacter affinis]MBK7797838.1 glutamate racemase [Candidatus Vicinibacter affinis]
MSNFQDRPIGIFDSGIGGLTVAQAINRLLPKEQCIYVGDTAHMPYGDKSIDLIRHFSFCISEYLLNVYNCKALVIACNTASAAAYEFLRDKLKGKVPVINVIDPMVEFVINQENIHHVGIIATKTTIQSGIYQEKFSRRKKDLKYSALATPLLAPMIEEGFYNNTISNAVLHEYLDMAELKGIDSLILGCTHYPLIKNEIESFYDQKVRVIDSAEVVAKKLKTILEKENMLNITNNKKQNLFFVTDYSVHFERTTKLFYGEAIALEKITISE